MIHTVFVISCDSCGLNLAQDPDEVDVDGYLVFGNAQEAWDAARGEEWSTDGHKHYCPACWSVKRQRADEAARAVGAGGRDAVRA